MVTGRVHPERADINFSPIKWKIGNNGRVLAQCDSSQISVLLDDPTIDGWRTAYVAAEHFAQIVVGALGFSLGSGYSVELLQVTEEDGTPHVFGVRPTGDTPAESLLFDPHVPIFNRALLLASEDVLFRLALRDFLHAITDTTDCATYCYRAIESIKSAFVFKTGVDRWDDMHTALGTDRTMIEKTIKQYADPVRHGNWIEAKPTDARTRWQMLLLTRTILAKYLDYARPAT